MQSSLTAFIEIYHAKDVQKSLGYTTMVPAPGAYNIFTAVDKEIHRFKRKVLSPGFSDHRVRDFEPTILKHVDIFVNRLLSKDYEGTVSKDDWSGASDMTECCRHLLYDIMGEFGFGQSFKMQTSRENYFLIEAVEATIKKAGVYVLWPGLQRLNLELLFFVRGMRMREKYLGLMSGMVKSRVAEGKDAKADLFAYLVDAKDPETGIGFTEDELWAESRFLLIAGADTSSTALTALFFYLSAYPDCYQKLAEEIRSTFSSPSEIQSGPKLSSCRYLRACIDEALRMSPPISGTLWREVTSNDFNVDGEHIPKGADIGVSPYAFHHNEDIFPDSFRFNPDRWIISEDNPKEAVDAARHMFSAFSIGSRACAGKTMAYTELSDAIARTAWYLDIQSAETPRAAGGEYGRDRHMEFQLEEHLTCCHSGPRLRFRVRSGAENAARQLQGS